MDILVPITMKNAAKCETQCELQNSASHQIFERSRRLSDIRLACIFQCVRLTSNIVMRLKLAFLVKNDS
jgi:hypothetical protein